MIGQIIQSYLVGLGVQIDKPGFQQADATIKKTGATVEKAAGSMGTSFGAMAANFVRASTLISSALAGVTASVVGLMTAAAKQDMAMQKYAASMMMGRDAAEQMKRATDALGESISDITLNPELMGRFKQLAAEGGQMRVGGDFKETMKNFRDLIFEFTRLKQEASYAMTWIGYYLQKYLQKPLADIKEKFRQFNDSFIKNMSVWTEKAARAIMYILNIGRHFLDFLVDVGKALYRIWDSFPKGVKIAAAALTGLWMIMRASPLGRMITLVGTLLLLLDDYYGHMEGKQAAFGEYWDKLNGYIETAKKKWAEIKPVAEEYWDRFVGFLQTAKTWASDLATRVGDFLDRVSQSAELQGFIALLKDLGEEALSFVVQGIQGTYNWLKRLYERMEENGAMTAFTEIVEKLYRVVRWVFEQVRDLVHFLGRLRDEVTRTEEYQEFTDAVADLLAVFLELLNTIMELVGEAMRLLFGELDKTDKVYSFRDAMRAVLSVITGLIRALTWAIGLLKKFFSAVKESDAFRRFWQALGDIIDKVIAKVGKLGRALLALKNGEFQKAWDIVKSLGDDEGKAAGTGNTDWNKRVVYERLKAAGYNDEAIAGIMGRVQQEHGFDTSDVPEHWATAADGSQIWVGGLGMFQWNGDRKADMKKWAEENGLDYNDPGVQTDYAIIEAKRRGLGPDEMNQLSVADAARKWTSEWEVGEPGDEIRYATEIYGDIKHGNGNTWMTAQPTALPDGSRGDLERQYFRKWSSAEGMDTPWDSNDVTDTQHFRGNTVDMLNALGRDFYNAFGGERLTITGGAEKGDYHSSGQYSHANGYKVDISDSLPESQRAWLENWLDEHESEYGILYNHEWDKGHYDIVAGHPMAQQTSYGGMGFMGGGVPTWQKLNGIRSLGKNATALDFINAMERGGRVPGYASPTDPSSNDSHNVSIGDIIVTVTGGADASAQEIGNEFLRVFPQAAQAAGFWGRNGIVGSLV